MKLENIKANFLGDSITEGCGVADMENVFWNRLKKTYHMAEARGYGIGGTALPVREPTARPAGTLTFAPAWTIWIPMQIWSWYSAGPTTSVTATFLSATSVTAKIPRFTVPAA